MWFFNNEHFKEVLTQFDSFVYIIERLNIDEDSVSPRYYIGKKTFYNSVKQKGKRIIVESDWYSYYGSSEQLSVDIEKYGALNFKRTILHLCRTKGDAGYLEVKEQINRNVLHINSDGTKTYYNKNVLGQYMYEPEYYQFNDTLESHIATDDIGNKCWVTDGRKNRLLSKSAANKLVTTTNWRLGRYEKETFNLKTNSNGDNNIVNQKYMISVVKSPGCALWIPLYEYEQYKSEGWSLHKDTGFKTYYSNNTISEVQFVTIDEQKLFLDNNSDFKEGRITQPCQSVKYAKDIRTGLKVITDDDELKSNPYLVSLKTKLVKIKKSNRIIFKGYIELFMIENPEYTKIKLMNALKSATGDVILQSDKLNIRYIN